MRNTVVLSAAIVLSLCARQVDACERISVRSVLPPDRSATRVIGRIIGYGDVQRPLASIDSAPSLVVRIAQRVRGASGNGLTQVVPLSYGPDCRSTPQRPEDLRGRFDVGALVAVFAPAIPPERRGTAGIVVVEANRDGFVALVPSGIVRTRSGDLDFRRFEGSPHSDFAWFEFGRAVLSLSTAPRRERFDRFLNVAHGLRRMGGDRQLLEQLAAEASLTESELERVLAVLPDGVPRGR